MFQNWGFLLGEIWGLILLAALLGLFAGWLIWSRSKELLGLRGQLDAKDRELTASRSQLADAKTELDGVNARFAGLENERIQLLSARDEAVGELDSRNARITSLEGELSDLGTQRAEWQTERTALISARDSAQRDLDGQKGRVSELQGTLDTERSKLSALASIETERDDAVGAKAKVESAHAEDIFRLRKADEEVARLKSQLATAGTATAATAALKAELSDAKGKAGEVDGLKSTVSARDREIAALKQSLEAANQKAASAGGNTAAIAERDSQIAALKDDVRKAREAAGEAERMQSQLDSCKQTVASRDQVIADLRNQMNSAVERHEHDYDGDGVVEGRNEGTKPTTLTAARNGQADDLKKIKGVGPKLEAMLHDLGFFHFDQVASWTADEVAWVDANLDGFNGRVSRDKWIEQAQVLARGGTTEFASRVEGGDVYD